VIARFLVPSHIGVSVMRLNRLALLVAGLMVGSTAFAAVPAALSTLEGTLVTDAGTIVGYSVALLAATFGTFWVIGLFKKAVNKGK